MIPNTDQNCNSETEIYSRFPAPYDFSVIADQSYQRLPHKPYCTDELGGYLKIRPKKNAICKRYIQHNPPCYASVLVFDIDREQATLAWYDENLPPPTWTTQNPENGHAHLAYALKAPVCTTEHASLKTLDYLAKIQAGLTRHLGADLGYSGFITKNPFHPHWRPQVWRQELYELGELAECVELKKLTQKERQTGFGRNCTLFDNTRIWAYEAVRDYRNARVGFWEQAVLDHALSQNTMFAEPLPYSEVKATAKSIAGYCLKHDSQCYNKFVERQREKGAKGNAAGANTLGGLARSANYADKRVIAVEMSLRGYSVADIARYFKVDKRQIRRWLSVTI